jgi:sulfite reductase alpha subunit-like flavoprotein
VELSLGQGSGFNLQPGDSVGVLCPNPDKLVDALLHRLSVDGDRLITLLPRDYAVDKSS